jgi:hypothetical protein
VPDIVQQSSRTRRRTVFRRDRKIFAETIKHSRHQVKHTERMREARMLCALISIERESQLLDPAQALKFSRVNETHHQAPFGPVSAKANNIVNRIAVDAFRHALLFKPLSFQSVAAGEAFYHSSALRAEVNGKIIGDEN